MSPEPRLGSCSAWHPSGTILGPFPGCCSSLHEFPVPTEEEKHYQQLELLAQGLGTRPAFQHQAVQGLARSRRMFPIRESALHCRSLIVCRANGHFAKFSSPDGSRVVVININHPLLHQLPGGKLRPQEIHAFSKGLVFILVF